MSRILRRPMFRGGRVDSRGTGITANLGYNNGGRVGYQPGGQVTGLDFLKKAFLGPRFTDPNFQPPKLFPKGVGMNFGLLPGDYGKSLSEGSPYREYLEQKSKPQEFETEVSESGDVKFKLD